MVVNQEMDEVLLGRPFLKTLRFDLNFHLNHISGSINGQNIKDFGTDYLLSATYRVVRYADDDDPIDPPHYLQAWFGDDSPKEIRIELGKVHKTAE